MNCTHAMAKFNASVKIRSEVAYIYIYGVFLFLKHVTFYVATMIIVCQS